MATISVKQTVPKSLTTGITVDFGFRVERKTHTLVMAAIRHWAVHVVTQILAISQILSARRGCGWAVFSECGCSKPLANVIEARQFGLVMTETGRSALDVTPGGCKFCVRVCAAIFIHRAWSYGQNTGVVPRPTLARIQIFDANFPGTLLVLNQIIGLALVGDVAPTVSCFCRITTISRSAHMAVIRS